MSDINDLPAERPPRWGWLVAAVLGLFFVIGVVGWLRKSNGKPTGQAVASSMAPEAIAARNKDIEARTAAARPLLASLSSKTDDMSETAWFEERKTKKVFDGNVVRFYFARFDSKTHAMTGTTPFGPLRFEARYEGHDWIFAEQLILKVDGQLHYLRNASTEEPNGCRWQRHVFSGGSVWEWCDVPLSKVDAELANVLANAREVKVRFDGSKGVKDWNVPKAQLAAMKHVYEVWSALPK